MTFLQKAGAAAVLLVSLLTWLVVRSFTPVEVELVDMRHALETLALNESLLHRDVLSSRAGLLGNYDPLVHDVENMRASVAQLKASDHGVGAPIQNIESTVAEEEDLVELFKTDNALLQNSLAYFDVLRDRMAQPGQDTRLAVAVGALGNAVAHLARDADSDVARLVQSRLEAIEAEPVRPEIAADMAGLALRGRLLLELLPKVDELLRRLTATSTEHGRKAVRSAIHDREVAQEQDAGRFRVGLYGAALLLAGLLVLVGLRLRAGAMSLHRRAKLEHLIGLASNHFIACEPEDIPSRIDDVLRTFSEETDSDRGYVMRFDGSRTVHIWCKAGVDTPAGWPEALFESAHDLAAVTGATFRTPDQESELPPALRAALKAAGIRVWSCVKLMHGERMIGLLCFDRPRPRPAWLQELPGLLRMLGEVIANALHRETMFHERRALEARLRQGQRLEAIGTFTSGVAHNFNNVIGTVLGHAEMAADTIPPESAASGHVAEIAQAGERARELVSQILDFGRRGHTAQHLTSLDALVAETVAQLRPVMPEIELGASGTAGGALVEAEPAQLQQVLVNLIRNAAQASRPGTRVSVELDQLRLNRGRDLSHGTLGPGDYVRVTVADEGRGMDAATLAKIFEPFFTTRSAGTGLGLATAFEIVNESGGAFDVRSIPDRGSTFEVWLREASQSGPAKAVKPGPRGTLMLVGANRDDVMGDEEHLAALGFEPVGFADPDAALSALRTSADRFDLVITDHVLQRTTGLEFAKVIREAGLRLPVILCLSARHRIEAEQLTAAGVADIVRRPWRSGALLAMLSRNLVGAGTSIVSQTDGSV